MPTCLMRIAEMYQTPTQTPTRVILGKNSLGPDSGTEITRMFSSSQLNTTCAITATEFIQYQT